MVNRETEHHHQPAFYYAIIHFSFFVNEHKCIWRWQADSVPLLLLLSLLALCLSRYRYRFEFWCRLCVPYSVCSCTIAEHNGFLPVANGWTFFSRRKKNRKIKRRKQHRVQECTQKSYESTTKNLNGQKYVCVYEHWAHVSFAKALHIMCLKCVSFLLLLLLNVMNLTWCVRVLVCALFCVGSAFVFFVCNVGNMNRGKM